MHSNKLILILNIITATIISIIHISCSKSNKIDNIKKPIDIDTIIDKTKESDSFLSKCLPDSLFPKETVMCRSGYLRDDMITLFVTNDCPSKRAVIEKFGIPDTIYYDTCFEPCSSLIYKCGDKFVGFHYKTKNGNCLGHSRGDIINGKFETASSGIFMKNENKM